MWRRRHNQGYGWRLGQIYTSNVTGNYRYLIEAVRGKRSMSALAIDDITVSADACPTLQVCDFEDEHQDATGMCGFRNDPLAKFAWQRGSGQSALSLSGPEADQTTQTGFGHYVYITPNASRLRNDRATLVSPAFKYYMSATKCVEVWYYAFGHSVGTLNVYKQELNGGVLTKRLLYSTNGEQEREWHVAQINVQASASRAFQIVFEVVYAEDDKDYLFETMYSDYDDYFETSKYKDVIALDDFELKEHRCQPMGSCDFEQDMCAWKNAPPTTSTKLQWIRHRGSTPSAGSGPLVDHTLGTEYGTYAFVALSAGDSAVATTLKYDNARLLSAVFNAEKPLCFEFFYHMSGSGGAPTLKVKKQNFILPHNSEGVAWTANQTYADEWRYAQVSVRETDPRHPFAQYRYRLIIEAEVTQALVGNATGDVAIDDLKVTLDDVCPTAESECVFRCSRGGACISEKKYGNFVHDCPDGEEEIDSGYDRITFDHGNEGKWEHVDNGEFIWLVSNFGEFITGPSVG